MATKDIKEIVTVIGTSYKNTSIYGNPSYWVSFERENGEYIKGYTGSDCACGYGCSNFCGKKCNITYHYTKAGKVIITKMFKPE